jgi:ABC-2 type transport system ATP-binding protein
VTLVANTPAVRAHAPPSREARGSSNSVLTARGLVRRFAGDVGVLGVDLSVDRHEVLGLVGPNGAGKTTLISLLCGLARPDHGSVEIAGRLALCPDTPEFEPWLTATEVLRQSFTLARPGDVADEARVARVLADTGVAEYADRRCGGFSRGMTQRLGIAAALVVDPDLLVLDEPTSALDPNGRADVLELIRSTGRERSVVLSSHALADVQRTTDRIAVMDAGRVLFDGAPRQLIDEHLRPRWRITLVEDAQTVAANLQAQDWVHAVRVRSRTELDVETRTLEIGERRLVPALAEAGVRVQAMTPLDADLESAFLALTGRPAEEMT